MAAAASGPAAGPAPATPARPSLSTEDQGYCSNYCSSRTLFKVMIVVGAIIAVIATLALVGQLLPRDPTSNLPLAGPLTKMFTWISKATGDVASVLATDAQTLSIFTTAVGGALLFMGTAGLCHTNCSEKRSLQEEAEKAKKAPTDSKAAGGKGKAKSAAESPRLLTEEGAREWFATLDARSTDRFGELNKRLDALSAQLASAQLGRKPEPKQDEKAKSDGKENEPPKPGPGPDGPKNEEPPEPNTEPPKPPEPEAGAGGGAGAGSGAGAGAGGVAKKPASPESSATATGGSGPGGAKVKIDQIKQNFEPKQADVEAALKGEGASSTILSQAERDVIKKKLVDNKALKQSGKGAAPSEQAVYNAAYTKVAAMLAETHRKAAAAEAEAAASK